MLIGFGAAIVLLMTPQSATPAQGQEQPTPTIAKAGDDEIVCKRISVRGSNIKKRVCATVGDWKRQARASREITREFQRSDGSAKAGT